MKTLKINSLPSQWIDRDMVMLHACFQILTDYVEKEWVKGNPGGHGGYFNVKKNAKRLEKQGYDKKMIKWETDFLTASNIVTKEVWCLYKWWNKTRPNRNEDKNVIDRKSHRFVFDIEDSEMLDRLIKIRPYLWT